MMVEAYFCDWLKKEKNMSTDEAYCFSIEISKFLKKLEEEGLLVVLRHDSVCYHCGERWPRVEGQSHVTICSDCLKQQNLKVK